MVGFLHLWREDHPAGIEGHGQALARALRVPNHADAAVPLAAAGHGVGIVAALVLGEALRLAPTLRGNRRAQRLFERDVHGVELVIAGHLLSQLAAASILEHDKVPHQVEKAALLEHAVQHHLQLDAAGVIVASGAGAPGLEPFPSSAEGSDARLRAVGGDQHGVGGKQHWDLRLIGLKLAERRPNIGVLVGSVLQLDHRQRQPVNEQHHIGPAGVLSFAHRELINREPVVFVHIIEVKDARLGTGDRAIIAAVFNRDAIQQHTVRRMVPLCKRRWPKLCQLAIRVLYSVGRQCRIETNECLSQAIF